MKRIFLLLFFIFSLFSFANQNYDDTKFRQDLVNWANSKIGQSYSMNNRWGTNTYDCSSFISRGLGAVGMTSISGKKSDYGITANSLYRASDKIVKGKGTEGLKAGDIAHFSPYSSGTTGHVGIITEVIDSCRVRMTHASNSKPYPKGGVKSDIKNLCTESRYLGATSATQVLINNGYTPVNVDGTVLAPVGSPVADGTVYYNSGYTIDFDAVLQKYTDAFEKGLVNIGHTLTVILTFVFLITFVIKCIRERITNFEALSIDLLLGLMTFVFYALVIDRLPLINEYGLKACFTVAGAFDSNLTDYKVLNQIMTIYIQNCEFLIKEFGKEAMGIKGVFNVITFNHLKITFLIGMIFHLTFVFGFILFEITKVIMTFVIAVNINAVFIPFYYSPLLREYIPNPLTIFFKAWIQLFFSIVFISISLKLLDNKVIPAVQNGFDLVGIFTYAVYFTIVAFVLRKMIKRIAMMV